MGAGAGFAVRCGRASFFFFFLELNLFNVAQKLVYSDGIHNTVQACTRSTCTVLYISGHAHANEYETQPIPKARPPHPLHCVSTTKAVLTLHNGGLPSSRSKDCDKRFSRGLITHTEGRRCAPAVARGQGGWGAGEFRKGR